MELDYTKTAARMPPMADRNEVRPDELDDYNRIVAQSVTSGEGLGSNGPGIDGDVSQQRYKEAWTNAPRLFTTFWALGRALHAEKGKPGQYGLTDHEMIDIVLSLDPPGYHAFLLRHTATAISAGVRIEAIEALAEGREEDLTDEERLQVEFIRAVRDLKMTDELWNGMVERLGSVRGAIYFAYFTCYLRFTQQMMWVFGAPGMKNKDWKEFLANLKDGTIDAVQMTHDYVWEHKPRPDSAATD